MLTAEGVILTSGSTAAVPPCPHCQGAAHRWGREHDRQRYRCRDCRRTYTETTGTSLARLRRRDHWHRFADAARDGHGAYRTARHCGIAASTAYRWRHRIPADELSRLAPPPVGGIISMFSGVGVLDLGFEQAGFRTSMASEIHPPFATAFVHARSAMGVGQPQHGVVVDSAEAFLGDRRGQLAAAMRDARSKYGLVGFVGGPPCPDFSAAGKHGGADGDHGRLTQVYADLIVEMQPDFFLFENVKGLWSTARHRSFYDRIRQQLVDHGYSVADRLVNALHYGAPQDRERIILVGFQRASFADAEAMASTFDWSRHAAHQGASTAPWPTATPFVPGGHCRWPRALPARLRPLTVQHWFDRNRVADHPNAGDYFEPRSGLARMLTVREGDTSRKSYKRLHRWRYSPTAAYGHNEVHLHPSEPRRLSVAEAMAIQSLPGSFTLPSAMTLTDKFKTIGNAVPLLLAEALARTLAECLRCGLAGVADRLTAPLAAAPAVRLTA